MRPLSINMYWGGQVVDTGHGVSYNPPVPRTTLTIGERINFSELVDLICTEMGIERETCKLNVYFRYPEIVGSSRMYCSMKLQNDSTMETLFVIVEQLSAFLAELYIETEPLSNIVSHPRNPNHNSFVSLLKSFPNPNIPSSSNFQLGTRDDEFTRMLDDVDDLDDADYGFEEDEDSADSSCPPSSEDESEDFENMYDSESSNGEGDLGFGDDEGNPVNMGGMRFGTEDNARVLAFLDDIGDGGSNSDPTNDKLVKKIPVWSGETNEIALGMRFRSKEELKRAITLWGKDRNREHKVWESKSNTWVAICNSGDNCDWRVRAVLKCTHKMWQITIWNPVHKCLGVHRSKGHMNLTSTMIASEIRHLVEDNPCLSVKTIQKQVQDDLNVEISYKKAWHARLKAIDLVYGNWEESFAKLPTYFRELKRANPGTIVRWRHHEGCDSQKKNFRFVFWAFHPAIEAFRTCRPVISVDGTFLKGSYYGKLLVAVTHDANDYVLPIAFAIVNEETTESWTWFMKQVRLYVVKDREPVCVISDRDAGLKNAMKNMAEWKEPRGNHRFCLRHLKSNYAKEYRNVHEKNLVWLIGSARQERKALMYLEELKSQNLEGWKYLEKVPKDKWCLVYDCGNSRWGTLTTNVSESYNNVLRGVRNLPITALVNGTFHRTVKMFADRYNEAMTCSEALPKRISNKFKFSEEAAQGHLVLPFDRSRMVYKVTTKRNTVAGSGGHVHKVEYNDMSCSCGKWQIYRRPCSHALAVCRSRCDSPLDLFNVVYTVPTFRAQYSLGFSPLRDECIWSNSKVTLLPDPEMFKERRRGDLGERRIRNEMDRRLPGEARKRTSKTNRSRA